MVFAGFQASAKIFDHKRSRRSEESKADNVIKLSEATDTSYTDFGFGFVKLSFEEVCS